MDFRTDKLLHGGDYNPEQWLKRPDILEKDIDMLEESGCNVVSLGIFSWSTLEPEEGVFHFGWLQEIIDKLYKRGISTILATPSGARPKWMADKYPEVLRVDETRHRALFGFRHNHCYTSPVYREKVHIINKKLAQEVATHPGVILWHISNEYGGECHCPLCQEAFRNWLKEKYQTIENLNDKWCTTFWSHTYNSFDQIESPSKIGETQLHALNLDWKRFVTHQTADFIHHEIAALREGGSTLPTTANLMHYFGGLDYFKIAKEIDVVSWDTYPTWHKEAVIDTAYDNGMCHDLMRSLKGKPFFQMESCPTSTNWQSVSKLKKPGMLFAQSMQAIAHGGEGALYFQIRQSRGASEKFHGAVIDHYGGKDTRVFREVTETGEALLDLAQIAGSTTKAQAAILHDCESRWAMEDAQGPRNMGLHYMNTVKKVYGGLRKLGVNVDFLDMEESLSGYRIVFAPMLYLFRAGIEEKIRNFVADGGTFVMTYWSGVVDENDLCFLGGTPHGLMDVFGLRSTELDALYDQDVNAGVGEGKTYEIRNFCDLVKTNGAETLLAYRDDFYAGYPALTKNVFGEGEAYYVCADFEQAFYDDFCRKLAEEKGLERAAAEIPEGLDVATREDEKYKYLFVQNYGAEPAAFPMDTETYQPMTGEYDGVVRRFETVVFRKEK